MSSWEKLFIYKNKNTKIKIYLLYFLTTFESEIVYKNTRKNVKINLKGVILFILCDLKMIE